MMANDSVERILLSSDEDEGEIIEISDEETQPFPCAATTTTTGTRNRAKFRTQRSKKNQGLSNRGCLPPLVTPYDLDLEQAIILSLNDFRKELDKEKTLQQQSDREDVKSSGFKGKTDLNWSQYKAAKLKSQESCKDSFSPSMGKEVLSSPPPCVTSSDAAYCREGRADISVSPTEPAHKRARLNESPVTCVSSSDIRLGLGMTRTESTEDDWSPTNPGCSSTPLASHSFIMSCLKTKKVLKLVKTEDVSDGELSDSLPDLEDVVIIEDSWEEESKGNEKPCTDVSKNQNNVLSLSDTEVNAQLNTDKSCPPSGPYDDILPTSDERELRRSSSNERHFMDFIDYPPPKRIKLEDQSEGSCSSNSSEVLSPGLPAKASEKLIPQLVPSTSNLMLPVVQLSDCIKKAEILSPRVTQTKLQQKVIQDYTGFKPKQINAIKPTVSELTKRNCKIMFPSFLDGISLPSKAVDISDKKLEFSAIEKNAVEASMEEGDTFLNHVVDLTQTFSLETQPTDKIISHIYKVCLLGSKHKNTNLKCYHILSFVQQKFPSAIKISWSMIFDVVNCIDFVNITSTSDTGKIFRCMLALDLIIQVLLKELQSVEISNAQCIRKCQAFQVLSWDVSSSNLKQITKWISQTVTCGEYQELCESYIRLNLSNDLSSEVKTGKLKDCVEKPDLPAWELKKVLPSLQKLLEIGILVSSCSTDCARHLAVEMMKVFHYLPHVEYKKLLLQTMTSDLLRFKLCQLFTTAYCGVAECGLDFPCSLQEVIENNFQAVPPTSHLTPPSTPSGDDVDNPDHPEFSTFASLEGCELVCMLHYYTIVSYVRCAKSKSFKSLRRRIRPEDIEEYNVKEEDRRTLKNNWVDQVETLRMKILEIAGDITPAIEKYLMMILCLGETV